MGLQQAGALRPGGKRPARLGPTSRCFTGTNGEFDLPVFQEKWKSGILKCNLPNFINVSN